MKVIILKRIDPFKNWPLTHIFECVLLNNNKKKHFGLIISSKYCNFSF